ncbi:MAG: signal peptidase I [Candidatus Sungbacteria bacterium]|nr:signal peptidase I [Candidatus Sungbacteria bacterium]
MVESNEEEKFGEFTPDAHGVGGGLWDVTKVIITSILIVLPIRYFIIQPFIVRGASMDPNFEDRQYLIVDEVSYYFREPERGEVIIFHYPRDPRQYFIKRIVGLPGDTLEFTGGRVKITNKAYQEGFTFEEPYLMPPDRPTGPYMRITLGEDEYFVLGDNRDASSDSRVWGVLRRELIVGRAFFRALPPKKFGFVPDYSVAY